MRLARELAERICALRYDDLPAAAVYGSRVAVLDTIGVALAGSRESAPRIVDEVLELDNASGSSLVFGTARRIEALETLDSLRELTALLEPVASFAAPARLLERLT